MKRKLALVVGVAFVLGLPARPQEREAPTLEERMELLESQVAVLDTRLERERTLDGRGGAESTALEERIIALERALSQVETDLQRLQRAIDTALREASEARRDAMSAEQLARDAASRAR
jgi:chaperonin cofactor prefoldin